jgi:hypothetical protein
VSGDNAALVWTAFQAAALRWRKVRDENPRFAPPMRAALDVASAVQELLVRGDADDLEWLAKLAQTVRGRITDARRSREPEERRRGWIQAGVRDLLARDATAREIVDFIEIRSPDLNRIFPKNMALPESERARVGRPTKTEERKAAVRTVTSWLENTEPEERGKRATTIIVRALVALGLPREQARIVAGARQK